MAVNLTTTATALATAQTTAQAPHLDSRWELGCEFDGDGDGVYNGADNCLTTPAAEIGDVNANGCAPSELDSDSDGLNDGTDNCVQAYNPNQEDQDLDCVGDVCDTYKDGDGIPNAIDKSWGGRSWVDASTTWSTTAKDGDTSAATIKNSGASLTYPDSYHWRLGKESYLTYIAGATESNWARLEAKMRGCITSVYDLPDCDTCQTTPDGIGFVIGQGSIFLGTNTVEITSDFWQTIDATAGDGQHYDGSYYCDYGPCSDIYLDWPMHPHNLGCAYDFAPGSGIDQQTTRWSVPSSQSSSFTITCGSELTTVEEGSLDYVATTTDGTEIVFTVTAGEDADAILYVDTDEGGNLIVENLSEAGAPVITFAIDGVQMGELEVGDEPIQVTSIDVSPNNINLKSKGKIKVAILSTDSFDATTEVDKSSLTFGSTGNEDNLVKCSEDQDANDDGLLDVVCHFNTQQAGFQADSVLGVLKGTTNGGSPIFATDSVRIVPPEKPESSPSSTSNGKSEGKGKGKGKGK